jgi:uncharacterized membrane protein
LVTKTYNQIAGRSLDRVAALSDGVFAIAMTLIVLEIRVPDVGSIQTDADLWRALGDLAPRFVTYGLSFLTLGIFWNGQQTQLLFFERGDRHLTWIHLAFLAAVALMPFSTSLLAEFIVLRLAVVFYWVNLFLLGVILYFSWVYARRASLIRDDVVPAVDGAVKRRIFAYQIAYAVATAACLLIPPIGSIPPTYWSIGLIVLTQVNSAIAPRIPVISRF